MTVTTNTLGLLALVALPLSGAWPQDAAAPEPRTYHVYLLAGQSNMDGYGRVDRLPEDLRGEQEGVVIFHGNPAADGDAAGGGRGIWAPLRPGHGRSFESDGETNSYSDAFGVELTFARHLRAIEPDQPVALIKYSRGGTSIHADAAGTFGCWDPDWEGGEDAGQGVNQYDHCLATLRAAFAVRDVDGDGVEDRLVPAGIVWMQGESDAAYTAEIAAAYEANLRRLMDLLRAALRHDDLPVVMGRISDSGQDDDGKVWDHGDVVRAGQAAFVRKDGHAGLITTTDGCAYSDPWHYGTADYLDLGLQFAGVMHQLRH